MNRSLLSKDNFALPTDVKTSLIDHASYAKFDNSGRYIAAGRLDGTASIWDLETRSIVRNLDAHVKAVTSMDWSRNSRYVLTSSKDWNVIIWDLCSTCEPIQRHTTIRFDAPVVSASFHPRNSNIVLVLLNTGDAYVVDLRKEHRSRVELVDEMEDGHTDKSRSAMTVARFDTSGKHIFIGTSMGCVLVFNSRTKTLVGRHKIAGAGIMRGFDFAKGGRRLVTNSADRTLRQFTLPIYPPPSSQSVLETELEPQYRFSDHVNRTAWHAMSYSPDGDFLAGGVADTATHKIYIYDITRDGQLITTLDGGRELLIYLHWHPSLPIIASTTNVGNILIWHCRIPERWGAFAGGFEEVDENVEYQEREDEFDIEDEADVYTRKMKAEEQEVDIDGDAEVDEEKSILTSASIVVASDARDEDTVWADEEPDDDSDTGGCRLKIIIVDEDYL
ncbi:hypothetical protein HGRIS_009160 [Hohenbuehelia grisea]|uniref:WD40 repeat-like protein n=1 Tax=Hohenbuehelia grisea TaxID=104357 RepID=A0ABR3J0H2_9AGAR